MVFGKDKGAKLVGLETLMNVLKPTESAIKTVFAGKDGKNHIIILISSYVSLKVWKKGTTLMVLMKLLKE